MNKTSPECSVWSKIGTSNGDYSALKEQRNIRGMLQGLTVIHCQNNKKIWPRKQNSAK